MIESCKSEITDLHQFFEDWFCGRLPDTDESFNQITNVLAPQFEMITPGGHVVDRSQLLEKIRSMNGDYLSQTKPAAIWIENMSGQMLSDKLCLMRYHEWQGNKNDSKAKGRLSSAIFKQSPETPNNVQWVHLHEVWLPQP